MRNERTSEHGDKQKRSSYPREESARPSKRNEGKGTPSLRDAARYVINYLKERGFVFFYSPPEELKAIAESTTLESEIEKGRFYTRLGKKLYIYVKNRGELIDPAVFPDKIGLFGPDLAWKMNSWMAYVMSVDETALDQAEMILIIHGYKREDQTSETLEEYFRLGDYSILEQPSLI
jgi:hypothetical protein